MKYRGTLKRVPRPFFRDKRSLRKRAETGESISVGLLTHALQRGLQPFAIDHSLPGKIPVTGFHHGSTQAHTAAVPFGLQDLPAPIILFSGYDRTPYPPRNGYSIVMGIVAQRSAIVNFRFGGLTKAAHVLPGERPDPRRRRVQGRRASGSGGCATQPHRRQCAHRAPQQGRRSDRRIRSPDWQ